MTTHCIPSCGNAGPVELSRLTKVDGWAIVGDGRAARWGGVGNAAGDRLATHSAMVWQTAVAESLRVETNAGKVQ